MKNKALLLAIAIACLLLQKTDAQVVISTDNFNILYAGIKNPVSIAVPGVPAEKVKIKLIGNGTIDSIGGNQISYFVTPDLTSTQLSLCVFSIKNKDSVIYGTKHFTVKKIPTINIIVRDEIKNNYTPIMISKDELPSLSIRAEYPEEVRNFNFPAPTIMAFNITLPIRLKDGSGSILKEFVVSGDKIPDHIIKEILASPEGIPFYIENISINSISGNIQTYKSYKLILK